MKDSVEVVVQMERECAPGLRRPCADGLADLEVLRRGIGLLPPAGDPDPGLAAIVLDEVVETDSAALSRVFGRDELLALLAPLAEG